MYQSEEVTQVKHAGLIQDEFSKAYEKRYHVKPFIEAEDLQIFQFLAKTFGLDRGRQIVFHYVKMNDDWFLKTAHQAKNLRKDFHKVNAALGLKQGGAEESSHIRIKTTLYCDKCHVPFEWAGSPTDIERPSFGRFCPIHLYGT